MQKRETQTSINANGKGVKPGQFAVVQTSPSETALPVAPASPTSEMAVFLEKARKIAQYRDEVEGHYLTNKIACRIREIEPRAAQAVFEDEGEVHYLSSIILDDGTIVKDFPDEDDVIGEAALALDWEDDHTYRCHGEHVGGEGFINIDKALEVPRYLTDPSYVDAQVVWSQSNSHALAAANTLAAVDFHRNSIGSCYEQQSFQDMCAERDAELQAAGVTR